MMKRMLALTLALCLCFTCTAFAQQVDPAELMRATEGYDVSRTGFTTNMIFGVANYVIDFPCNQISQQTREDGWVEYVFQPYGPYELEGKICKTGEEPEPLITVRSSETVGRLKPQADGSYVTVDEAEKIVFSNGVVPDGSVAETIDLNGVKARIIHPVFPEGYEYLNYLSCFLVVIPENSERHEVYILNIHSEKVSAAAGAVCLHIVNSLRPYGMD